MSFKVVSVETREWAKLSAEAHLVVFGEQRKSDLDRIDFVLLALDDIGTPSGYITCIEMDSETLYWQHGGALPNTKDSLLAFRGYEKFVEWGRGQYKRITTRIENTNLAMLKMALRVGFLIQGTWTFKNQIYVELCLEFKGENI